MHNVVSAADDTDFFDCVHELLEAERQRLVDTPAQPGRNKNHRRSDRRPFDGVQLLRPFATAAFPVRPTFAWSIFETCRAAGFPSFLRIGSISSR